MPYPSGDLDRDTRFLQSVFDKGGRVPPGRWAFQGPLLYSLRPVSIGLEGVTLEYVAPQPGWQSGFAICSRGYRLLGRPRARGLSLDFGRTGQLLLPENGCTAPRKGIGITDTDRAQVLNARVFGPNVRNRADNRLFAFQIHNSSDVLVRGGYLNVVTGGQGADGIHLTGTCRRVKIERLQTLSGDDGTSLTHEEGSKNGDVLEDITFVDCRIDNVGHSAVKGLILSNKPRTVIRRWSYSNCDLVTRTAWLGAGAPVRIWAEAGLIEDVSIEGGRLRTIIPLGGGIHEPTVSLRGIRRFSLRGTAISHFTRSVLAATNCPDLIFAPASLTISGGIRAVPPNMNALVTLLRCSDARVALPPATQLGWRDQVRIRTDGRDQ